MPEKSSKPTKAPRKSSAKKSTAENVPANEAPVQSVAVEAAVQPKEKVELAQPTGQVSSTAVTANEAKGDVQQDADQGSQADKLSAAETSEEGAKKPRKPIKQGVRVAKKAPGKTSKKDEVEKASDQGAATQGEGKELEKNARASAKNQKSRSSKSEKQAGSGEQASGNEADDSNNEDGGKNQASRRSRGRGRGARQQEPKEAQVVKVDTKTVAQRAWKIFLSEVSEEGIALISDKDAHELARRSLRVAEIYSREEAIQSKKNKEKSKKKSEA